MTVGVVFWVCVERLTNFRVPLATPEIATVLLTAASLLLVLLTAFFAVFAILGWAEIKQLIAARVAEVLRERDAQADGRIEGTIGVMLCFVSVNEAENILRRDLLDLGIAETQAAHDKFIESGRKTLIRRAANNLAYYLALRYQSGGQESLDDLRRAIGYANLVRKEYRQEKEPEFLLTCVRVYLLGAAVEPEKAWKSKAKDVIDLLGSEETALTARQRRLLEGYRGEYSRL